jgi:GT2 family glycosyltransferase
MENGERPRVTAIVPAYNAEATIGSCLRAIFALRPAVAEVIVYDDGATDRTHAIARAANARILCHHGPPRGPAHGRNAAAAQARSDLLLFVDADVVVAPDSLERLVAALRESKAAAAFGSYDDRLVSRRATSIYANLRHHFVHQHSPQDATTFWAGIGLIDRSIFISVGGYDAKTFVHPSIEDVELGIRLVTAGHRIRLVPQALGTHYKDWSLFQVWYSDVVRRAYPWSCLIADKRTAGADLNVATSERVTALFAVAIPALLFLGFVMPSMLVMAALMTVGYMGRNRRFFGFLAKRVRMPTLAAAIAMHWLYHCYASVTFAVVMMMTKLGARRRIAASGGS